MIYKPLKALMLRILKAPTQPPEPPIGSPDSVEVFRASTNFLKYQIIVWGIGLAAGLIGEFAFVLNRHSDDDGSWEGIVFGYGIFGLTILFAIAKYFLIRIDYDMRYYVITDRSLRIREGALLIHEATFTFANVQNLKIHQGPLERLLGISNLIVETAGGAGSKKDSHKGASAFPHMHGHQGVFRGIENAQEVRDQILSLLKQYRDSGLGDPEERNRARLHQAPRTGFSPIAMTRLREIRDEIKLLH
ncbi:MAG: PH domain-containing protein [Planctomycetes bacterium]|nr:PH domain-containing protein [Planctomycetota bacterium]